MENVKTLSEPLRISDSGNYELSEYKSSKEIAITGALLMQPHFENNLYTTIKIINKDDQREFDRLMLLAHANPTEPDEDKIFIKGKFFNPKKHFLKIETRNKRDEINFLLYFSVEI